MSYLVLGLVVCAGIAAIVAGTKGNSRALGCMFGLVLGPIGVLVTALLPASDARPGMRICPVCAEPVRVEAKVCRYCLAQLPVLTPPPPLPPVAILVPIVVLVAVVLGAILWPH